MKHITKVKRPRSRRPYESPLRDDQTDATRRKILDGLVRTMARGVAGLSVPAVARESGVSVPTVYRHFPTKAKLVDALAPHLMAKTRLMEPPVVEGDDLGAIVREMYRRNEAIDVETRAALASRLGQHLRQKTMPQRWDIVRKTIGQRVPGLSNEELDRLSRLCLILMSSATMRAYKDYLGMNATQTAEEVAWTLDVLQRALSRRR